MAALHPQPDSRYRWVLLILGMLTNTLVAAAPGMCLPVLFAEISADLDLTLVQVGVVWGIGALPGIVTVLLGGAIGDRIGPRRVLIAACALVGLAGALRGMATGFVSLAAAIFLFGAFSPFVSMNTLKTCGTWFPRRQLGLASGVLSMGMALGFLLSSLLSATVLSPALGGWRNVLYLYGAVSFLFAIPWIFTRAGPISATDVPAPVITPAQPGTQAPLASPSLLANLRRVARLRPIWLYGLVIFGVGGCVQGALGYLPLFLRGQGWANVSADGVSAVFHTVSLVCVIPIALLSDRIRSRRIVLVGAGLMIALGVGLLAVVEGPLVWVAVITAGMVRDGFMAVLITAIIETDGVGSPLAGTATGMVMVFSGLGSLLAPPFGNSLEQFTPGAPFLVWAGMALAGLAGYLLAGQRRKQAAPVSSV
jgi:MFS family permease